MVIFWRLLVGCFEPVLPHLGPMLAHLGPVVGFFGPVMGWLGSSWARLRQRWQPKWDVLGGGQHFWTFLKAKMAPKLVFFCVFGEIIELIMSRFLEHKMLFYFFLSFRF